MKKIAVIIFVLLSNYNSFAGGVDVGNGMTVDLMVSNDFVVEQELVDHIENARPIIEQGRFLELDKIIKKYKCANRANLKDMEVQTYYPLENGRILSKKYRGLLKVELNNCLK